MTDNLSRRERQIMEIIFTLGRASGPDIQERLPDQPSYSGQGSIDEAANFRCVAP